LHCLQLAQISQQGSINLVWVPHVVFSREECTHG
jgi:hypothetical protein